MSKKDVFSFIKLNIKTEREKNDASKCRNWHRYQRKRTQNSLTNRYIKTLVLNNLRITYTSLKASEF